MQTNRIVSICRYITLPVYSQKWLVPFNYKQATMVTTLVTYKYCHKYKTKWLATINAYILDHEIVVVMSLILLSGSCN